MQLTLKHVQQITRGPFMAKAAANAASVIQALIKYGPQFGLDQPHRLAQFIAQIAHETGDFQFDREVWGPTPAQLRYEGRRDLGNTQPGDGSKFRGHTGIQITGRHNTTEFRDWCWRNIKPKAPDFVKTPAVMNTDPWEGLGPIWYWQSRNLNKYADQGDVEMITRRINGGLNGYDDRVDLLVRTSLVLLGYAPTDVKKFQNVAGLQVDGDAGPKTRSALHKALVAMTAGAMEKPEVTIAPVVEEKTVVEEKKVPVPVAPPEIDKPVTQTSGFWERITQIIGALGTGVAALLGDWRVIVAIAAVSVLVAALGLLFHKQIIDAVKRMKTELAP